MARAAMLLKSIPGSEMQHTIKKYSLLNLGWCFCDILGFLQIAIHPIQMWCTTIWWKVAKSFVFVSFLGCVLGSVPPRPSNIQFVGSGTAWRSTHRDQRKASAPQMPILFLSNIQELEKSIFVLAWLCPSRPSGAQAVWPTQCCVVRWFCCCWYFDLNFLLLIFLKKLFCC